LKTRGALVIRARTVNEALTAVEDHRLSAAVLDCGLSAGDTSAICERMSERNIPFISYSHEPHNGAMPGDPDVKKPIAMPELIAIVKRAIAEHLPQSGVQYRPNPAPLLTPFPTGPGTVGERQRLPPHACRAADRGNGRPGRLGVRERPSS
jgi:DNA-binding response OmpR family regulator